jgi:hypothetical protein
MKCALAVLLVLLSAPALGRGGGMSPGTMIRMRRVSLGGARPSPRSYVSDGRQVSYPRNYGSGRPITSASAATRPPAHVAIAGNPGFMRGVNAQQRVEIQPGHYYWHNYGGIRYCHTFAYGVHWYGFYFGATFYWTRYWDSWWWWYDPLFARWVFWYGGYWWWQPPGGVLYVYVDNNYYPYNEAEGTVITRTPESVQPPSSRPLAAKGGRDFTSPDGRLLVQVAGSGRQAVLYDKTDGGVPSYVEFLANGVADVKFSGGKDGRTSRILLDFADGTFALFDAEGNPIDAEPESPATPRASQPSQAQSAPSGAKMPAPPPNIPSAPPPN